MLKTDSFSARVEELVAQIPRGRVMTYGQIAALCGSAQSSRIVGGIAHFSSAYLHTNPDCPHATHAAPLGFLVQDFVEPSGAHSPYPKYDSLRSSGSPRPATKCEGCGGIRIPWQRVVNKKGGLAAGYPGGRTGHKHSLEQEGVKVFGEDGNYFVQVDEVLWHPGVVDSRK